MSKTYPWHERTAEIEHKGQALSVTLRRPESGGEWEIRTVRVPADSVHDSEDISAWLGEISTGVLAEIRALTEEAFMAEDDSSLSDDEEEQVGEVVGRLCEAMQ